MTDDQDVTVKITFQYGVYKARVWQDEDTGLWHGEVTNVKKDIITFQSNTLIGASLEFAKSVLDYEEFVGEPSYEEEPEEDQDNDAPPDKCPVCGGSLEVDEEYMLDTYGSSYTYMPWREWSFYCLGECGAAGLYDDISMEGGGGD